MGAMDNLKVISQALGQWASERTENKLSADITFGPVRLDAARFVDRAVTAATAPQPVGAGR
jgi:hypothetical protein